MFSEVEAARRARLQVEAVRRQLLAPILETFALCEQPLCEAIGCLEHLVRTLPTLRALPSFEVAQIRREVRLLQNELLAAGSLLGAAASFYEGLGRLMSSDPLPGMAYGSQASRHESGSGSLSIHG